MDQQSNIIGLHIKYFDYLGLERFGRIIYIEPYPHDSEVVYVYIEDEESEFNTHSDILDGKNIKYAEIRLSTEIYLYDRK